MEPEKLNEIGLRNYIRDRILGLLKEGFYEENEPQPIGQGGESEQEGVGYSIDTFVSDAEMKGCDNVVIPAFTNKMTDLKAMCDKYGIEFEWSITRVESDSQDPREKKHKSGWKISANAAMPDLKVAGYTYVGSVVPMTATYAVVAPAREFKDNVEVLDKIRTTVAREKCAGCNRSAERGIYYVFREDATGDLKKFGSTCARKYLGISVDASIGKVFNLLYNELHSDEFSFGYDDDGFFFGGRHGDWRPRGYDQVAAACAYFAIWGIPEARFSFKYCKEYEELVRYYQTIDRREPYVPSFMKEISNNYVKINNYISSFYSNVFNFSDTMEPQSDFDYSIKDNGLYLGGVRVTKAGERRFRSGIFPYVVLKFLQAKRDEGLEVTAVEEFYGTKEFKATILNKVEKRSVEGNGTYIQVYAKTDNNEYLAWYQNQDSPELGINAMVTVYGEYGGENGKYCVLRRVRVMGQAQLDQRAQRAAVAYPDNGFRYRNAPFVVVKGSANYAILRDQNGCEYFVSNTRKDRWGEVVGFVIDEWQQVLKPGNTLRLTGTVDSYVDRYGETKHKLTRVAYDTTSFPEIDYTQYDPYELAADKKKIVVDGRALDIRRCWPPVGNNLMVQWNDMSYSVYDMQRRTIVFNTNDYYSAESMAYAAKYINNPDLMANDRVIVTREKDADGFEVISGVTWIPTMQGVQVSKGDFHLVFMQLDNEFCFLYYNPRTLATSRTVALDQNGDGEVMRQRINQLYNSI